MVDASGSAALNRLGEAKGAVELLLAECYARRDQVALLAFRGRAAELLLPPTSSLVRAKRSLSALPGGGGTPLAAGLDAALAAAAAERRRGRTPTVVLLTDGRANVARDGAGDRARAEADALAAARARARGRRRFRAGGHGAAPAPLLAAARGGDGRALPAAARRRGRRRARRRGPHRRVAVTSGPRRGGVAERGSPPIFPAWRRNAVLP